MTDALRWLLAAEVLSLIGMPLVVWTFQSLPDRGVAFAKLLTLVLVTWISWLAGNVAGVGTWIALPWLLLALIGAAGWLGYGRATLAALRANLGILVAEEALFLIGFMLWAVVRSLHPDIAWTEKPMDLMLLQTTSHAATYPPQDLWLAGHTVNYYYFGYLFLSVLGRLAGTSVLVSYNLSLALIFGLALAGAYSISYNLVRRKVWSLLGPLFVVLLGNAHALFFQVLEGHFPWNAPGWYWESTRIVGETAPGIATTINEFPFFSFVLGDLHPHVIAIPVALLAITFALLFYRECVRSSSFRARENTTTETWTWRRLLCVHPAQLALAGIAVGSLFAINPWDFPTYTALVVASILLAALQARGPFGTTESVRANLRRAGLTGALLIALAVAAFLPFYFSYRSPTHGVGLVSTATNPGQLAQILGSFGFLVLGFLAFYAWQQGVLIRVRHWLEHAPTGGQLTPAARTNNLVMAAMLFAVLAVAAISHRWVLLTGVLVALAALYLLLRQSPGTPVVVIQDPGGPNVPQPVPPDPSGEVSSRLQPVIVDSDERATPAMALVGAVPSEGSTTEPPSRGHVFGTDTAPGLRSAGDNLCRDRSFGRSLEHAEDATESATADRFVVLLVALAALLLAATEVVYLRDSFDGSAFYRMNTVFKFYYQIWILLGLAAAYAAARLAIALRQRLVPFAIWVTGICVVVGIGGIYTVLGPLSYYGDFNGGSATLSLNPLSGIESLQAGDPQDFQAISWIRRHVAGSPVILEATGGEYTTFARVSTYTGLPTLLGWQGHEAQWRGNVAVLNQRHAVIDKIYSIGSPALARRLLQSNNVSLVYVGPCERQVYGGGIPLCGQAAPVPSAKNALTKFRTFMRLLYDHDGVQIYQMPRPG